MPEQNLVSLQEMQARFEHLKDDELEIACEVTIPVTISVYRGHKVDGSVPPLYCHLQFEGDGYAADLVDNRGDPVQASTLEDVSEAFNLPMDAKIWEITAEAIEKQERRLTHARDRVREQEWQDLIDDNED